MPLSHHLPWQVNLASKIVLSRLPVSYRLWKRVGFFNLGAMERPEYALSVFYRHFETAGFSTKRREGYTCLELGPGDSVSSALIANAFGASQTYLVDVGPFAVTDMTPYRELAGFLQQKGLPANGISAAANFDELMESCSAKYLTNGLSSLREIPSDSVDFVFSHASLQQVRRRDFLPILRELRRIQKKSGAGSHSVSMRDLIGGGANDLRFSERAWESPVMAGAGFYTNRIRYSKMMSLFKAAGFSVEVKHVGRWNELPISRDNLNTEFSCLSNDDLLTYEWDVVLH